jgi:glycosyltransferase involved in cell wall biosynthesis
LLRFNLEKKIFKRADKVIAVSREDKGFMEDRYGLDNVIYLTNGIESPSAAILNQSREELRKELNLPGDWFLFVTVARFNFQKGYDILLRSLALLKDFLNGKKIKFVLIGKGPEFGYIKNLAERLSVSAYISFLGERHDSHKLIKAGNVFLLPSRWEGLPLVLLECGFLKVPVIASDTYGNREVLGSENGLMFPNLDVEGLADTIKQVFLGEYNLVKLADNLNQEVYKNYNIEKMITGLRQIYRSFESHIE